MAGRPPKTGYFLNRAIRQLALVGRNVRLPAAVGVWLPVADDEHPPWRVAEMLAATFPDLDAPALPFVALLADADVMEFENELRGRGQLLPDLPDPR